MNIVLLVNCLKRFSNRQKASGAAVHALEYTKWTHRENISQSRFFASRNLEKQSRYPLPST
jgi:hypothetical protein